MDDRLNNIIKELRNYDSEKRCEWILKTFNFDNPEYSFAFLIFPHFTWRKTERMKLMEYYFEKIPFASERPYLAFLKVTPLPEFLRIIDKMIDKKHGEDLSLLEYHLRYVFEKCIKKEDFLNNRKEIDRILLKCANEPVNNSV